MNKKINIRKFKKIICVFFASALLAVAVNYKLHNFSGYVTGKYVQEGSMWVFPYAVNNIKVRIFLFGEKDFVVTDSEEFRKIQTGKKYVFKKKRFTKFVQAVKEIQ